MSPARALARRCFVIGPVLQNSIAGTTAEFIIVSVDAFGNERSIGGDAFVIVATYTVDAPSDLYSWEAGARVSPREIAVIGNVIDTGNGTYFASVRPAVAGHHHVAVTTHGLHIKGSPFLLVVEPSWAVAGWSTADWGPGLRNAIVNMATTFTATARDKFGNPVPGADTHISCEVDLNTNGSCVSLFGNGSALCTYTPVLSGKGSLTVKYKGMHIAGSPFQLHIGDGEVDGNTTKAYGTGLSLAVAGEIATFTVTASDAGNNLRDDADVSQNSNFSALLVHTVDSSQAIAAAVTAMGEGIYNFAYNTTLAGTYDLLIIDEVVKIARKWDMCLNYSSYHHRRGR